MNEKKDLTAQEWKDIGNRIKNRRKSCELKQFELAEKIDISVTHMSSIENGRQHPSIYVLLRISEVLNTTPDYFLLGNIRRNNVPKNIIDLLNTCNESDLALIRALIEAVRENHLK